MISVKYSGKQRISKPLFLRRVSGKSMDPYLKDSSIVFASSLIKPKIGSIILFEHNGLLKIKYLKKITPKGLFTLGLNSKHSSDSRFYGLIDIRTVKGVLIWPLIHNFSTSYPKTKKNKVAIKI